MAVEGARGCGYRKVGGLYLVSGDGVATACDRLPLAIVPCECCGEHPRFTRGIAKINPQRLWGNHHLDDCRDTDLFCQPLETAYMMWVSDSEYTAASFIEEARRMGVSKRIPFIPDGFQVGVDWVYLARTHAVPPRGDLTAFDFAWEEDAKEEPKTRGWKPGIFFAFRPTAVEKIVTATQSLDFEAMQELEDKGIKPVIVPDDDRDHQNTRAPRRKVSDAQ